jgi:hypothetical protein
MMLYIVDHKNSPHILGKQEAEEWL